MDRTSPTSTSTPSPTPAPTSTGTPTHCPYCALQCAMTLVRPEGAVRLEVTPREFPTNRGGLCRKGWTAAELLDHPDRLTTPLARRADGGFAPIGWDEAYDRWVAAIRRARETYGPDAVGVFGGASLTNEKAYQLGKFVRIALGSSRIDYNGRFCMSSAAAAGNRSLGLDRGLPFPVTDLDDAHTVLLIGSNPADTMPPFVQHLAAARAAGGLLVIDPRRSATAALTADGAGVHLQPTPGTDLVLLLALAHVVVAEGLVDQTYLTERTVGLGRLRPTLNAWWPERAEGVTGVPAHRIREVARRLAARPRGTYVLTGRGVEQHADGTDTATAAINLALLLGLPGGRASGFGTLTGQGNGQGAREHGQKADQLPGYRSISDPRHRREVAAVWGVNPATIPGPGVPAVELLAGLGREGGVRCLWVNGANVVVSAPDAVGVADALDRLDFLVVTDFFLSETARHADLVLPVPQWAEEEGTMTNLEGRVLRRRRAIDPPPGVRGELRIMADLAARLGAPGSWSTDPAEVFDELARASAGGRADYSGLSYALLDAEPAYHWPVTPEHPDGTPRAFTDRFGHPDGRARLVPVRPRTREGRRAALLVLTTGRALEHYQSGTQTRRVASLAAAVPEPRLEIHPDTAARWGIGDGELTEISSATGRAVARAVLSTAVRPDTVFVPFHFAGTLAVNRVVAPRTDPVSGMPDFKATPVSVRPVREEGR
ncbi:molybdopterin oxidoreductase family protein [Raineyella sp. LH-20]|uniref:molybdopterin oxidoreductase family protein n=1 Tax=Raineyella sp. LH-20 TaxID=3081204 RepID=UPI0029529D34|nr:molybdopterin oxidoreductase family protein [Raineyella sp. LH-20]WOP19417.1 molybdopterin oxidoreductase family protein [Raineyella sp. LH-20]